MWRWVKIDVYERGLVFQDGRLTRVLEPGRHVVFGGFGRRRVEKVSVRKTWLEHKDLEVIAKSGLLEGQAVVLDLKDHERALIGIDGRLNAVRGPGLAMLWTVLAEVRVERLDARAVHFEHEDLAVVLAAPGASQHFESALVPAGSVGLAFHRGRLVATLPAGLHALFTGEGPVKVVPIDLREQSADVSGQEIMTADKVTLRLNAVVLYRVTDPVKAVTEVDNHTQALYRQAQLALRAVVGTRDLDTLLSDKDGVVRELEARLAANVAGFGLEVRSVGVRDVILPGEMREILNRVTEARKAAEEIGRAHV